MSMFLEIDREGERERGFISNYVVWHSYFVQKSVVGHFVYTAAVFSSGSSAVFY